MQNKKCEEFLSLRHQNFAQKIQYINKEEKAVLKFYCLSFCFDEYCNFNRTYYRNISFFLYKVTGLMFIFEIVCNFINNGVCYINKDLYFPLFVKFFHVLFTFL